MCKPISSFFHFPQRMTVEFPGLLFHTLSHYISALLYRTFCVKGKYTFCFQVIKSSEMQKTRFWRIFGRVCVCAICPPFPVYTFTTITVDPDVLKILCTLTNGKHRSKFEDFDRLSRLRDAVAFLLR